MTDKMISRQELIDAIEESTKSVWIMVPSTDYYARRGDIEEHSLSYIDPNELIEKLNNL